MIRIQGIGHKQINVEQNFGNARKIKQMLGCHTQEGI